MHEKKVILVVSAYKIIINTIRIVLGLLIVAFGFNIKNVMDYLQQESIFSGSLLDSILSYIHPGTFLPSLILAISLILFSIAEIVFIILILKRKYSGAIGLFVTSILWIPSEILFVSRFLVVSKILGIAINLVIILFFFRLIIKPKGYFKK